MLSSVIALAMGGMAALFGYGAYHTHAEHSRYADFGRWVLSPGTLKSMEVGQTLYRMTWHYGVACEYAFVHGGREYAGKTFDLRGTEYHTLDEAKAGIEGALGIAGRARWSKVQRDIADAWVLDTRDIAISVRHSPRDPTASSLTATPPMQGFLDWVVIVVLAVLALVTAIGCAVLAATTFRPGRA